jgi:hypothetical protein
VQVTPFTLTVYAETMAGIDIRTDNKGEYFGHRGATLTSRLITKLLMFDQTCDTCC